MKVSEGKNKTFLNKLCQALSNAWLFANKKHRFIKSLVIASLIFLPAYAYEDCLVTTDGKLTEIRIEDHEIIDVYPLITIMNDKNTLFVHPLKTGETRFSVLKNNKDIILFNVKVNPEDTVIDEVHGFDILTIDAPPEIYEYELDFPPVLQEAGQLWTN